MTLNYEGSRSFGSEFTVQIESPWSVSYLASIVASYGATRAVTATRLERLTLKSQQ